MPLTKLNLPHINIQYYYTEQHSSPFFIADSEYFTQVIINKSSRIFWKVDNVPISVNQKIMIKLGHIYQSLYFLKSELKYRSYTCLSGTYTHIMASNINYLNPSDKNIFDNTDFFINFVQCVLLNDNTFKANDWMTIRQTSLYEGMLLLVNTYKKQKHYLNSNDLPLINKCRSERYGLHSVICNEPCSVINTLSKIESARFCVWDKEHNKFVIINHAARYTTNQILLTDQTPGSKSKVIVNFDDVFKLVFFASDSMMLVSIYTLLRNLDKVKPGINLPKAKFEPLQETTMQQTTMNDFLGIYQNLNSTFIFNKDTDAYEKIYAVRLTSNTTGFVISVSHGKNTPKWTDIKPKDLVKITNVD